MSDDNQAKIDFAKHSADIAGQYTIDLDELQKAYENKHDSLSTYYTAMMNARTNRWIMAAMAVATAAFVERRGAGILGAGIALAVFGYAAYRSHQKVQEVGVAVNNEIKLHNRQSLG